MDLRDHLQVSSKKVIDEVVKIVEDEPKLFEDLMLLALSNEYKVSWRAAWAVVEYTDKHKEPILTYLEDIINRIPDFKSDSQRGCFLKIFTTLDLELENMGSLIDICFELIATPKKPTYIRYYSMRILENIAAKEPALKHELAVVLEQNLNTIGSQNYSKAGKEMLERLRNDLEMN